MPRYVAFLRAINVGGRTVKMDALRAIFEDLKLQRVSTFIASGNVIFETRASDRNALERKIESQLNYALGFDVATMLRTDSEVARVAAYEPFERAAMDAAAGMNVGFLSGALDGSALEAVERMTTDIDKFHVHGCEVYWMCSAMVSESKFSNVRFEKACGRSVTFRSVKTVRKLAGLYPPG